MKKFRCLVCGEIINEGAEKCPVCGVGPDKWEEVIEGQEKVWATEHKVGEGLACGDEEIVSGLRANFEGECTEVGMYLAMSRVADREGYPEIAEAYKRIAFEEAEHASKFAELLGECVSDSTEENLNFLALFAISNFPALAPNSASTLALRFSSVESLTHSPKSSANLEACSASSKAILL